MASLRLFAQAREVAGAKEWTYPATTVQEMLDAACREFGDGFEQLLPHCRVWVDGEPAEPQDPVTEGSEVAVLPPVSGG